MNIVDLATNAYSSRLGRPVRYGVLHTTEGYDSRGVLTRDVSIHYLVRREHAGIVVYRIVSEEYAAWHCGIVTGTPRSPLVEGGRMPDGSWSPNPNLDSIGIEIEGFAHGVGKNGEDAPVDLEMVAVVVELIRDIRTRHPELPFISHAVISPGDRSDPGIWLAPIEDALEGEMAVTDEEFKTYQADVRDTLDAMKKAYDPLVAAAVANGHIDAAQEAEIAALQGRIDKLHSI